ncbi:hypothetical protein TCAL_11295 [Tigriopus californicus]|uniref:RING-type domain-containing protein n=1 Tax=Tigriopus californicus TaxID=6832 RepID=A0A553P1P9_TIGCA|nr:sorting nexin-2-like [Tigriopus californicus]TRY71580.1 hypothetical protein TCAL_11295 [Tigriopus californicus]|eukprot:TCALIF_11295-PA protein Name:"Similar to Snx2 Sorting nexin-2 (Mus musculus)" AED:0.16 eAED:0.16 QI:4608/1/1/1/1/1/3/269/549
MEGDSISASDILNTPTNMASAPPNHNDDHANHSLPGSVAESPDETPQSNPRLPPIAKNSIRPLQSVPTGSEEEAKGIGWRLPLETVETETDGKINDLLDMLECPICLDTADKPPIYQCPEGHLLCEDCNSRLSDCPQCGHALLNSRNRTAEELAHRLQQLKGNRREMLIPSQHVHISVSEPRKIRKGLFSHVAYQLTTRIGHQDPPTTSTFKVDRRYSDILKLYQKLQLEYQPNGIIIPPPPEKKRLATIAIKMSTDADLNASVASEVISKRCVALDRYMKRMCKHPVIRKDPNFRSFIQEHEVSKAVLKSKSISEKFSSWAGKILRIKSPFSVSEQDPWFQTKVAQLNTMSQQMKQLEKNLSGMSDQKRKLGRTVNDFQAGLSNMSVGRTSRDGNLNQVIKEVIQCHKTMAQMQEEQSKADEIIEQLAVDYQHLVKSAKTTLQHRSRYQKDMQKVQKGKNPLEEIEKIQVSFDKISQTIRRELEHFDFVLRDEFEEVFRAYNTRYWASLASGQDTRSRLNTPSVPTHDQRGGVMANAPNVDDIEQTET